MRSSNEKGFFLIDALLSVFLLSCLCILCFSIYGLMERYEEGYIAYQERTNEYYAQILSGLNRCEGCSADEHD
ncbi:MAG: hypothetical protein IIZ28_07870 [Erysipelotrichaceae bacterium]|nr:hypothetical protein [Erysipelotrichaceae bacterium]MBQ1483469.1 hypothetical protein [Erysipelotrichaceae bacterium]